MAPEPARGHVEEQNTNIRQMHFKSRWKMSEPPAEMYYLLRCRQWVSDSWISGSEV